MSKIFPDTYREVKKDLTDATQVILRGDTEEHRQKIAKEAEIKRQKEEKRENELLSYGLSFVSILGGVVIVWVLAA